MEIHNTTEDIVFGSVEAIFDEIEKEGNPAGFCLCGQCRMDTVCYVLNRCEPRYIVSNRGFARLEHDTRERQQIEADTAALVHEGIRRVNHNQRPTASHNGPLAEENLRNQPAYNIPTIVGRLFDGTTFAPLSGIKVELRCNGGRVTMKNRNWQNPYILVANTAGTFTFWPAPVPAEKEDDHKTFEYSLKVESPDYEPLTHYFKIPAVSKVQAFTLHYVDRTFKLPDLYMFPPGEAEKNGY